MPIRRLTPTAVPAHDLDDELNHAVPNNPIIKYAGHRLRPSVRDQFSVFVRTGRKISVGVLELSHVSTAALVLSPDQYSQGSGIPV
jgi:hypothetical protein